jgi:Skp family chaperone for outer membrane proteins
MKTLSTFLTCTVIAFAGSSAFGQEEYTSRNQNDSSTAVLEQWEQTKAEEQLENLKHQEKEAKKEERRAQKELKEKRKALKAEQKAQRARKRADRLAERAAKD